MRQREAHSCPGGTVGSNPNIAGMGTYDLLRNCKPKTAASGTATSGTIDPKEPVEDLLRLRRWYTGPRILYTDDHDLLRYIGSARKPNASPNGCMLDGILQKIIENLCDPRTIGGHREVFFP